MVVVMASDINAVRNKSSLYTEFAASRAKLISPDERLHVQIEKPTRSTAAKDKTVLLLHGSLVSSKLFDIESAIVKKHLVGKGYNVILVDLPGHGQSAHLGPFTFAKATRYIYEQVLIPHGPMCVIGHSLGGQVILQLQRYHPSCITRAIIFSTPAYYESSSTWYYVPSTNHRKLAWRLWGLYRFAPDHGVLNLAMAEYSHRTNEAQDIIRKQIELFDPKINSSRLLQEFENLQLPVQRISPLTPPTSPLSPTPATFPPTLVVEAKHDLPQVVTDTPRLIRLLRELNMQSEAIICTKDHHDTNWLYNIQQPDDMLNVISDWIDKGRLDNDNGLYEHVY